MVDLTGLASVVLGGVTLHNALQYVVKRVTAPVVKLANDVATGNVQALEHDAKGVRDFMETHLPGPTKAVEEEAAALKAAALAEVDAARHAAAEELRRLAEGVEKAAGVPGTAPVSSGPTAILPAPQAPSVG